MASDNNIDTGGVPVQAPSAHRGGGRRGAAAVVNKAAPVEATSSGRKRKRGTRPPIPTCSSDEILDLTIDPADIADASVANWCDNNLRILCEICAQEVGLGNRSSTHLNKTGYKNLINKFKERTGLLYTRRQFKNKWDKLKAEHTIWKKLIKQSGIGWKEGTRNIDMPDDWWLKMDKEIKGVMWFKEQGLQNEENISKMFDGLLNTGDDHWNPSSGVAPSHSLGERSTNYADEGEADNDEDDSDPDEVTEVLPTSGKGKKVVDIDSKKGKKPKTSGGHWFQEQMEQMVIEF
ncbi:hypothetical protein PR202_gb25473 [Eleusine coracana subsp. coracana]|uniref:Myb/SANT-like domain-containing protein n=1 Tax=Eleusine coracana subsp. coracana TaxID=191504 RepID=A0AAV5FPM6_ELECO|nr:hypothetical protein PR202_gb25473 [Eleusine coracana subsp. coracana]